MRIEVLGNKKCSVLFCLASLGEASFSTHASLSPLQGGFMIVANLHIHRVASRRPDCIIKVIRIVVLTQALILFRWSTVSTIEVQSDIWKM